MDTLVTATKVMKGREARAHAGATSCSFTLHQSAGGELESVPAEEEGRLHALETHGQCSPQTFGSLISLLLIARNLANGPAAAVPRAPMG